MTTQPKPAPLIKAAPLWAKSSVKGGQYLTGRLGGMKVLILENRDRQNDDDPSHHLFVTEAPERRQGAAERPQERSGGLEAPTTHPGRLRRHHSLSAAAFRGMSAMGPMMCRHGSGDGEAAALVEKYLITTLL